MRSTYTISQEKEEVMSKITGEELWKSVVNNNAMVITLASKEAVDAMEPIIKAIPDRFNEKGLMDKPFTVSNYLLTRKAYLELILEMGIKTADINEPMKDAVKTIKDVGNEAMDGLGNAFEEMANIFESDSEKKTSLGEQIMSGVRDLLTEINSSVGKLEEALAQISDEQIWMNIIGDTSSIKGKITSEILKEKPMLILVIMKMEYLKNLNHLEAGIDPERLEW